MQAIDVTYAYQQVTSAVATSKKMREDSFSQFHQLFIDTTQLGQQLHGEPFELLTPRIAGRQAHRSNRATASPEDYFRITNDRLSALALMKINIDLSNQLTSGEKMKELVKSFAQLHLHRVPATAT